MIPLNLNPNVDNSDLVNYPDGRIRDNDGTNNGTGVNRSVYGDLHSNISKLMRLYGIIPSNLPDNETNGFQIIESLRALASKNDFIYPLTTDGTILSVDIKFSQMLDNEYIVCLAAFNKGAETQIKGIGSGNFSISYSGNFRTNEYVRVIKTSSGVSIIRIADALSLDAMATEFLYLKKATGAETIAGVISTKAVTPESFLQAFAEYVIGATSSNFLATALRNGLYPKEHFSIVDGLGASPVKNIGWVSGIDPGSSGASSYPVSGNIISANSAPAEVGSQIIDVNFVTPMNNLNYKVRFDIQSESANILSDNRVGSVVFKPTSTTSFRLCVSEFSSEIQSLKIHIEIVQL